MKARDVAIAAVIALAFSGLLVHPAFDRLYGLSIDVLYWMRDAVFESPHKPDESPTVVIAIEEETYRTPPFAGTPNVMWTKQIAAVLDAAYRGGAKVIGWDVILPASASQFVPQFDRELLQTLLGAARNNRVLLGMVQYSGGKQIVPFAGYQAAVGRGRNLHPLNVVEDPDGVFRRAPLFFRVDDTSDPNVAKTKLDYSMALAMATRMSGVAATVDGKTGDVLFGDYRVPARPDDGMSLPGPQGPVTLRNDMLVQFDRGPASIPTYSLEDLYQCVTAGNDAYFREHFAGKAVMFGTVLDNEDRVTTSIRYSARNAQVSRPSPCAPSASPAAVHPTFGRDSIAGIYMQASAINTLLRGKAPTELDKTHIFLIHVALAAICAVAIMLMGPVRALLVYSGLFVLWAGAATYGFHHGLVLPLFQPMAAAALTLAALLGYRFAVTDRQGRHIRSAFQHYLAPAMVKKLVDEGRMPEQGGEMREVSVWLSDLENYSTIAEQYDPVGLVDMLNGMYSIMGEIVEKHNGFVAQYIGDAMVAVFGAPLDDPDHAKHAVDSAMECQRASTEYGKTLTLPPGLRLHNRIGVASGRLLAGNVGAKRRLSYTVIGDDINLAARIEGVNKVYGSAVMVAEATKNGYGPGMVFRECDIIRVKGRAKEVRIYEPIGREEDVDEARRRDLARFAEGLQAYRERDFVKAKAVFEELAGRDPVAKSYIERCDDLIRNPPPDDWDAVNTMLTK